MARAHLHFNMSADAVEKRLGYLAKSLDMNSDAVALLMQKAESLRGLLQMQSLVTAETGVSQKYQEKIDELAGQVSHSRLLATDSFLIWVVTAAVSEDKQYRFLFVFVFPFFSDFC